MSKERDFSGYKVPWGTKVKEGGKSPIVPTDRGLWQGGEKPSDSAGGKGSSHKGKVGGKD